MTPADLITALRDPAAYAHPAPDVEVRQTHISVVFLAGERAYKVKKPVRLDFLDFSTLEKRRFFCEEEVRLNRRLCPDVYLGVVPVVRTDGGVRLDGTPGGEVVDYAVCMRRLPEDRMLERLLAAGRVSEAMLDEIVAVLAEFHRRAPAGPEVDRHARPEAIRALILGNLAELKCRLEEVGLSAGSLLGPLEEAAAGFLSARGDLLERRIAEGRIREGHGDLHAGNVCLAGGRVIIYDCIEFDMALRCVDTARDVGFLVMDLAARGHHDLARHVARRYAAATSDSSFECVLPLYTRHLACVRSKVGAIAAADPALGERGHAAARESAYRYLHLAAGTLLPPVVAVLCGLPGSGKSTLGRPLAAALGAALLRSDVIRKRLAGIGPTDRPRGVEQARVYSPDMSHRTYQAMEEEAASHLAAGRGVVADATFATRSARKPFIELARRHGAPWVVVHLDPGEAVVHRRLSRRGSDPHEVSDADLAVYERMRKGFEPPNEVPADHLVRVTEIDDSAVGRVLGALLECRREALRH